MRLEDAAHLATIATPVIIAIGFAFAYLQWKSTSKTWKATANTRMAQIILSVTERWDSREMEESRQKLTECGDGLLKCLDDAYENKKKDIYPLIRVGNFFDALGAIVVENFLESRVAFDVFGEAAQFYYGVYKNTLEDPKYKDFYRYFRKLNEIFTQEKARRSTLRVRNRGE